MRTDLLDGVVAFTRVAERRSITAAAAELGVTPAAVSWTVKQLEQRVGVALLTRTTRSVNLTEAGALFLARAQAGVAEIAAGVEAAQTLGERPARACSASTSRPSPRPCWSPCSPASPRPTPPSPSNSTSRTAPSTSSPRVSTPGSASAK